MITFKQLEAFYWVSQLGGFEAAGLKLNMSQSAVSKRILELEETFEIEVFDRTRRSARLTEKGTELLAYARGLLEQRDYMLERVSSKAVLVRHFRLGVTELTAMTWLPALVEEIRRAYPKVIIEPSVELGSELVRKLEQEQIDLIIVPEVYKDSKYICTPLQSVENVWMCSPGLIKEDHTFTLDELSQQPMLTQGSLSGTGLVYERWFAQSRVQMSRNISSNNLLAQVGLAISGLGITYLPKECLSFLVDRNDLRILKCQPNLPRIRYVALHRMDRQLGLSQEVANLAEEFCDFSRLVISEL